MTPTEKPVPLFIPVIVEVFDSRFHASQVPVTGPRRILTAVLLWGRKRAFYPLSLLNTSIINWSCPYLGICN